MFSMSFDEAHQIGADRWKLCREVIAGFDDGRRRPGSPREAWFQVSQTVAAAFGGSVGPATRSYLAACWFRREELDRRVNEG
jgi:hypothetical protein